jgi:hypothetical protein
MISAFGSSAVCSSINFVMKLGAYAKPWTKTGGDGSCRTTGRRKCWSHGAMSSSTGNRRAGNFMVVRAVEAIVVAMTPVAVGLENADRAVPRPALRLIITVGLQLLLLLLYYSTVVDVWSLERRHCTASPATPYSGRTSDACGCDRDTCEFCEPPFEVSPGVEGSG